MTSNVQFMNDGQKILYDIMNVKNSITILIKDKEKLEKRNKELEDENKTLKNKIEKLNKYQDYDKQYDNIITKILTNNAILKVCL